MRRRSERGRASGAHGVGARKDGAKATAGESVSASEGLAPPAPGRVDGGGGGSSGEGGDVALLRSPPPSTGNPQRSLTPPPSPPMPPLPPPPPPLPLRAVVQSAKLGKTRLGTGCSSQGSASGGEVVAARGAETAVAATGPADVVGAFASCACTAADGAGGLFVATPLIRDPRLLGNKSAGERAGGGLSAEGRLNSRHGDDADAMGGSEAVVPFFGDAALVGRAVLAVAGGDLILPVLPSRW